MSGPEAVPSSFRDPSGFLFMRDGVLYRQVNEAHQEHYDRLMASGLYEALVESGLMVSQEEVGLGLAATGDAYKVVRPERVDFVSHPYEWCFGQLQDAALATLRMQELAMGHGMSLRDASAYNIQFHRGRPVLIDTLSFEVLREGVPWVAYRQFCQHFLAPLALMAYRDVRLGQLLRVHIDGVPLDLSVSLLPRRARLRVPLLIHLFLHARSQRRHAGDLSSGTAPGKRFTLQALRGLIDSLGSAVSGLTPARTDSHWVGYYEDASHYPSEAGEHKRELVASFIDEVAPATVWDLGANTGLYSRIASDRGIPTVSFDVDAACVEESYRRAKASGETSILPLVIDLTNPSPAVGWDNRERMSLGERGPADLAMALALTHHLAIANNVPLPRLAQFFAGLCKSLIVEFVPKDDEKVRQLLAGREDIFPEYTREGFERAFKERFDVVRCAEIRGSERMLYLMRAR